MPLRLPQRGQSKKQQEKQAIWLEISLQKKNTKVASTRQDQKNLHNQQRCLRKYTYHQKNGSKLLMKFDYYNHEYIVNENGVPEYCKFAEQN